MVKRYARVNNAPAYKTDDKVLVRYRPRRRGNIPSKGHIVIEGTIVKKSKNNPTYMARIMLPNESEREIDEWVSTEDLADPSSKTEKQKRLNEEKRRKLNNCEKSCVFL